MKDHSFSAFGWDTNFDADLALAREALARLSPDRADDRDAWIKVGMALHGVNDGLLPDWIEFSKQSNKFKPGECEKLWRGFKHDKARSLGIGSLVRWAREDSGDASFGKARGSPRVPQQFASIDDAIVHIERQTGGKQAGLWRYELPDGRPWFWSVRIDLPRLDQHGKREKTFRPIRPVGDQFEIGDPPGLLVLYRLADLPGEGPVDVFEGEKAAEIAAEFDLASTTSAHGANSAGKSDWTPLAGRDARIFPDNDPNGLTYARAVGAILTGLEPPAIVSVVKLPDLPPGGDIADFVELRRSAGKSNDEIKSEIAALPAEPFASFAGSQSGSLPLFQDPIPLPDELPKVQPFDFDLLPTRLAPWVRDIAERMQCAADFLYAAVMVALATVVGRKVGIRPKRFDTWLVVINLWGAVIGRPGILKTPAVQEAFRFLFLLELRAKEAFGLDRKAHEASKILADARRKENEKDLRRELREGGDGLDIATQMATDETKPPTRQRYVVNDSTVEKLGEILNENPNGVLSYRDELVGLLRSLDKEGQEGARGFYLQAWNGDGRYTYDRIGRGTIDIEAAILCVFGSIQPGPLARYLLSGAATGNADDGLLQRFQLVVWPDQPKDWQNHDREPDRAARGDAQEVFQKLNELTSEDAKAERDAFDLDAIPFLRFAEDAQVEFDQWRARLERRLRAREEDEAFESHLAKYRSLVPSLALIYHLVDVGRGPVGLESLRRALRAVVYLESHARRVFAATISAELAAAHALANKILQRTVESPFTLREVYQHGWTLLKTADDVGKAVAVLIDHNWLVEERTRREKGAPKTSYVVNPRIWDPPGGGPGRTGGSPQPGPRENAESPEGATGRTGTSPKRESENGEGHPGATGTTGKSPQGEKRENRDGAPDATGRTGTSVPDGLLPVLPVPLSGDAANSRPPTDIVEEVKRLFDGTVVSGPTPAPKATPPAPPSPPKGRLTTPSLGFEGSEEVPYD